MPKGFLPVTDSGLMNWARNFASKVLTDYAGLGLTQQDAEAFAELSDAYAAAFQAANQPGAKCKVLVCAKNTARTALKKDAGRLARFIGANSSVSNETKIQLGLTIRRPYTRIPSPSGKPTISVRSINGWSVHIQLREIEGLGCRLPAGVAGANIYCAIHNLPEGQEPKYQFFAATSRADTVIQLPTSIPPGTRVSLAAQWFNPRHEAGNLGFAVDVYIQHGIVSMRPTLKAAA